MRLIDADQWTETAGGILTFLAWCYLLGLAGMVENL